MTPIEELEKELGFRVGMDDVYYATDGISYTKVRKPRGFEPELWTALLAAKQRMATLESAINRVLPAIWEANFETEVETEYEAAVVNLRQSVLGKVSQ